MKLKSIKFFSFLLLLSVGSVCFSQSEPEIITAAKVGIYAKIMNLIQEGADVNVTDQYGNTALHFSVFNEDLDHAKLLISVEADVNARNNNGDTPLHIAYGTGNQEMIDLLISKGADESIKNNENKIAKECKP